jgi:hypothetical protein
MKTYYDNKKHFKKVFFNGKINKNKGVEICEIM